MKKGIGQDLTHLVISRVLIDKRMFDVFLICTVEDQAFEQDQEEGKLTPSKRKDSLSRKKKKVNVR
jgi:hypothetical protein